MSEAETLADIGNRIPALRVVLTSQCNLRCEYCPPNGENFSTVGSKISSKKLLSLLEIFYKIGFRQFGFTGGDPFLRNDFSEFLSACKNYKNAELRLYTNGVLLKRKAHLLEGIGLIKLGLDTLDAKKFKQITGSNNHKDVFDGIEAAKSNGIKIRVNAVLIKRNVHEIFDLVNFCSKNKLDLKILDLNCYDFPGYDLWRSLYENPAKIIEALDRLTLPKCYIQTVGGYGIPMPEYFYKGIYVRIKDTHKETTFAPICYKCPYFPCQEGLYHLTLTVDGCLKMCRHRPDLFVDLSSKNTLEAEENIKDFLEKYYYSVERLFVKKQVFQGYFGKSKKRLYNVRL